MTQFKLPENEYLKVGSTEFAYKKLGTEEGIPLVFIIHFRGTMENWDPLMLENIAKERPVILFDNVGVGYTDGETPSTIDTMAEDTYQFINGLGYQQVDILGFSIGVMVAQSLAIHHPDLVRKLILSGTAPAGGIGPSHPKMEEMMYKSEGSEEDAIETFLFLFYPETRRELGKQSLNRIFSQKTKDSTLQVRDAQLAAIAQWTNDKFDHAKIQLHNIENPTLVINGDNDIMVPTENSFMLSQNIPDAQLIIYPNAGHGHLFQHPVRFANHVNTFLNE
ncbi:alpha/beta fold hydrolase [Staphylococcus succinus]|uniref:Alpha/beta hydrolase n=1 Tax=Staphylococcus succinus TaxID=61015 RepID=A0ABX5IMJ7_9STAP|nr:alpha/beta hydrolase [Staphylococcus succinus]PTI68301.1 alpha/beta hydrolase [Staphylococcus succinus]RIN40468.1 alpha/beta hydrolase [Staphylococcus succinus]